MIFSQHHPSSFRPHVTLMLICLLAIVVLSFVLVLGWQSYFGDVRKRNELIRIGRVADARLAERAAERAEKVRAIVLPTTKETPSTVEVTSVTTPSAAEGAKVSLTEMTMVTGEDSLFPDPVPIADQVSRDRLDEANVVQQRFWQAANWRDKLAYVHEPDRVGPLMADYYEQRREQDPLGSSSARQAHFKINNTEVLLFTYASARPGGTVDVAMIAQPDGRFLIDWESYVGMSDMAWSDMKKQRPGEPKLVRVFAQRDDYYNYEFSDAKKLLSVHLTSPDGTYFIYGFCDRNSPVGQTLNNLFDASRGRVAVTLRVAWPPKAESDHCAAIKGIVANRWLLVK